MGNLRDQLQQANLLSKKHAKRLAHEARLHHQAIGGAKGAAEERAAHTEQLTQRQAERRSADREREAAQQAERAVAAERIACEELLRREIRLPSRRGAGRWFFCLSDGRVPFLELSMPDRTQLAAGALCIVRRTPGTGHDYGLLATEHARRIAKALPDRIAWRSGEWSGE